MKSRALTRLAATRLIAGFVAAAGFAGMAAADNLVGLPDSSEKDSTAKSTAACMPQPSGPAYQDWRNGAIAYNDALDSLKRKDSDRAAAQFDTAIKIYPNNALAHVGKGRLYRDEGKYDRAIEKYNEAIKIAPNCFVAFIHRCYTRAIKGDLDAALTDCNEALRLYQGASYYDSRGFVYLKMGHLDKAIADYDTALQMQWNHPYALWARKSEAHEG